MKENHQANIENLEMKYKKFFKSVRPQLDSLKRLDKEQITSVLLFSMIYQNVSLIESVYPKLGEKLKQEFFVDLEPVFKLRKNSSFPTLSCLSELLPCAMAEKKCRDEGRKEQECFESWEPCSKYYICLMEALSTWFEKFLNENINKLLRDPPPPPKIEWPRI